MAHDLIHRLALRLIALLAVLSGLAFATPAQAEPLDHVRKVFAELVHQHHRVDIHDGRPQPLLRAIVVMRIRLDEDFHWTAEVLRDKANEPEMTRKALLSIKDLPVPDSLSDEDAYELTHVGFVEAWLFENNGRYCLKTLAKPQLGS